LPVDCSQVRGTEGDDFDKREGKCWYSLQTLRASFPEYADLSDYAVSKKLYEKSGVKWDVFPWSKVLETAAYALGAPLLILALGWSLIWALSGFRGPRNIET
jgi:hypothetical protein